MAANENLEICGNEDLPEGTPERPLVTFALFAYNQEKYIREAVEGAFAQTYWPLEIILSDDCSTDRTFEIMKEMAAAYEGPHQIRVRKSRENVGTLRHLLDVANISNGIYFVVAAGDDISLPDRTEKLARHLSSSDIAAVSSDDIVIDEAGSEQNWQEERIALRDHWHKNDPTWLLGASAAYSCDLLKSLPRPQRRILHEDTALQDVLAIYGKRSVRLHEILIKRRSHSDNISFKVPSILSVDEREKRSISQWQRIAEVKQYCADVAFYTGASESDSLAKKYKRSAQYFSLLAKWPELKFNKRLKLLSLANSWQQIRTCLIRLFGLKAFRLVKSLKANRP